MSGKKRQTFGKMQRERAVREKRERKQEKKEDKKQAAAEARNAALLGGVDEAPAVDDESEERASE